MIKFDNTQQNIAADEALDQVSGGVNDIPQNELYQNGNEIDLLNTDFLPENLKQ